MKDSELVFDRSCHVIYSKPCKAQILGMIARHYPESEREGVWENVQKKYARFLSDWRTDLGGKKNFHNGAGGNYDCIVLMAYYVVCRGVTSLEEIEEMEGQSLPSGVQKARENEVYRRKQAVREEADVQGVHEREKAVRQMGRF